MSRILVLVLILSTSITDHHERVEMSIRPYVCLAPCSIIIHMRIDPRPENDGFAIEVDGTGEFDYWNEFQLHGDAEPAVWPDVIITHIPAGEYEVIIETFNNESKRIGWAHKNLHVS